MQTFLANVPYKRLLAALDALVVFSPCSPCGASPFTTPETQRHRSPRRQHRRYTHVQYLRVAHVSGSENNARRRRRRKAGMIDVESTGMCMHGELQSHDDRRSIGVVFKEREEMRAWCSAVAAAVVRTLFPDVLTPKGLLTKGELAVKTTAMARDTSPIELSGVTENGGLAMQV
ncbi:hypothetical protein SVAN01_08809 [Stagonosporopsis vannaccii]|nr:hypothetical protein SVAN01_08809 [Stagonosporopsis vannaccii]